MRVSPTSKDDGGSERVAIYLVLCELDFPFEQSRAQRHDFVYDRLKSGDWYRALHHAINYCAMRLAINYARNVSPLD